MRSLETVSCSLNLGLIYSLDYSYSPESGVSITIFFVNENGEYNKLNMLPMQKASIKIGSASFSLYPKSYKISKGVGRRVMSVEFVDEMFKLDNFYITLTGRGSGKNIYELGRAVDNRTTAQKIAAALDQEAEKLKNFTQFPDLEYTFDDFLSVLRKEFSVEVNASYNNTITRSSTGTFKDVLSDWCSFFNLAFYFENSKIKIYDPTRLTITLPSQPSDALSYEISEDIESTYGKTVVNYFQQEGGEKELNQSFDDSGSETNNSDGGGSSNTIKYINLYPIGYEFNLEQTTLDLNQVAAAMYGKEFWFLYNLANDKLAECGWTKTNIPYASAIAEVDDKVFEDKFEAYVRYGTSIAGKWYMSNRVDDLTILMDTKWYSEAEGQIFDMESELANERAITPEYLEPPDSDINFISETIINEYFPGVKFFGKRVAIQDKKDNGMIAAFTLTEETKKSILLTFKSIIPDGNDSVNLSGITGIEAGKNYMVYKRGFSMNSSMVPADIYDLMDEINKGNMQKYFKPRYSNYSLKGLRKKDIISRKDQDNQPTDLTPKTVFSSPTITPFNTDIIQKSIGKIDNGQIKTSSTPPKPDNGPQVVSNTSLIKVKKEGSYVVYYDKYSKSASNASVNDYFGHRFEIKRISDDNNIGYKFSKIGNTYNIERDLALIASLVNNPYLPTLAQERSFPTKSVSFTLNYYYQVPQNFLSNGLVGIQMSLTDNGVSCSYTFSNAIMQVPDRSYDFSKYEETVKNSWIRTYRPKEVISE